MLETTRNVIEKLIILFSIILIPFYFLSAFLTVDGYVIALKNSPVESMSYRLFYFPLFIGPMQLYIPIYVIYSPTLSELLLFLITVYMLCLMTTIVRKNDVVSVLKSDKWPFHNPYISTVTLTNTSLVIILIIQFIQEKFGVETGEIKVENELVKYVSIAIAPLIEEVGFRLFLIGLILVLITIALLKKKNITLKEIINFLIFPIKAREKINIYYGKDILKKPLIILIISSGILFGSVHYFYGGGWEIGKISTATIAGLLLGYLYVKFGIDSSILSHYTFNHFFMTYYYYSKINEHIVFIDFIIILHGLFALIYGILLIIYLRGKKNEV